MIGKLFTKLKTALFSERSCRSMDSLKTKPQTHDYTERYWGHDYTFKPLVGGLHGRMTGWGRGIKGGDYLIIQNGQETSRYIVDSISYYRDPSDMWEAEVSFAPRTKNT